MILCLLLAVEVLWIVRPRFSSGPVSPRVRQAIESHMDIDLIVDASPENEARVFTPFARLVSNARNRK